MTDDRAPAAGGEPWQIWVDTGGTFTDCLAVAPGGTVHRAKVLSSGALRTLATPSPDGRALRLATRWSSPGGFFTGAVARWLGAPAAARVVGDDGGAWLELDAPLAPVEGGAAARPLELVFDEEAPSLAARLVTGTPAGAALPRTLLRLATTRGTNALLERRGVPVALFVTSGFGDLLHIGTQQRDDLFALAVRKPAPLYAAVCEVAGRRDAAGAPLVELDLRALARAAAELVATGIRSAAVAFLHSYRRPDDEHAAAAILRAAGFTHVSVSADLAPRLGIGVRAETAVVDAYLAPVVGGYLDRVERGFAAGTLHVMTSAGGLLERAAVRAKDALLSGPAAGVVGAAAAAERSGVGEWIAFDMGGTSTDVSRWAGEFAYAFEHAVGDGRVAAPALRVETVAAGGGSVCDTDGVALLVGPRSAGASPGPACYGAGGPLTITDVNLLLGRLDPGRFGIPVDAAAAARALDAVARRLGGAESPARLLDGFLQIANERMADAIRRISVREGYDPRQATLLAFGGAGGQHACALAELLGMSRVLVPADASLLSAFGLGRAVLESFAEEQVLAPLAGCDVGARFGALAERATAAVVAQGVARDAVVVRRRLATLRLAGQDATIALEAGGATDAAALGEAFASGYRALYGYAPPERPVEVEALRVVCAQRAAALPAAVPAAARRQAPPAGASRVGGRGREVSVPHYERGALAPGDGFAGPALVFEPHSTLFVAAGWTARCDGAFALLLAREAAAASG